MCSVPDRAHLLINKKNQEHFKSSCTQEARSSSSWLQTKKERKNKNEAKEKLKTGLEDNEGFPLIFE